MLKFNALVILLLLSFTASADENAYLWGASSLALLADWGTTLDQENHPGYIEKNRYLGPYPTRGEVNRYFAALFVLHGASNIGISRISNRSFRRISYRIENASLIVTHGFGAVNNFGLGMSLNF